MLGNINVGMTVIAVVPVPGHDNDYVVTAENADGNKYVTWRAFYRNGKALYEIGNYFYANYDSPDSRQVTKTKALRNMVIRAGIIPDDDEG